LVGRFGREQSCWLLQHVALAAYLLGVDVDVDVDVDVGEIR